MITEVSNQLHKGDRVDLRRIATRQGPKPMSADMRRLVLAMLAMVKREYPDDWRRMLAEMVV